MAWLVVFTAIQDNDPNIVNELKVGAHLTNSFYIPNRAQLKTVVLSQMHFLTN